MVPSRILFHCAMMGTPKEISLKKKKGKKKWSSCYGSVVMNLTSIHEDVGLIPGPTQWLKDLACCETRLGSHVVVAVA